MAIRRVVRVEFVGGPGDGEELRVRIPEREGDDDVAVRQFVEDAVPTNSPVGMALRDGEYVLKRADEGYRFVFHRAS